MWKISICLLLLFHLLDKPVFILKVCFYWYSISKGIKIDQSTVVVLVSLQLAHFSFIHKFFYFSENDKITGDKKIFSVGLSEHAQSSVLVHEWLQLCMEELSRAPLECSGSPGCLLRLSWGLWSSESSCGPLRALKELPFSILWTFSLLLLHPVTFSPHSSFGHARLQQRPSLSDPSVGASWARDNRAV